MRWIETDKGDPAARELADRHYTRQSIGARMFTRPGYNQVLIAEQANGRRAVFVWWRPKWESGIKGTERFDRLRCIECTIFRNETRFRSSDLILEAISCLLTWDRANDTDWKDGIITAVNSIKTSGGRSISSPPGMCFRAAGFRPFGHAPSKRADIWLRYNNPLPPAIAPDISARLFLRGGM